MAAQPPAIFVLLFRVSLISSTMPAPQQFGILYLMDVFGLTFAILIILYLSSLFNWKTVGLFAVLLTTMDIILVIQRPNGCSSKHIHWAWASSSGLFAKCSVYYDIQRLQTCLVRAVGLGLRRLLLCRSLGSSNIQ